jgi:hypothetical protein
MPPQDSLLQPASHTPKSPPDEKIGINAGDFVICVFLFLQFILFNIKDQIFQIW